MNALAFRCWVCGAEVEPPCKVSIFGPLCKDCQSDDGETRMGPTKKEVDSALNKQRNWPHATTKRRT